ncbi:hypothetical protein GCM10009557_31100 [Virgisporangium ochraceum]|uniref:Uncharacterized protein n=1 Tax=Virgisporangium ochraceum TaxID=65505 RepID=A0A8J4A2V3_9ACTN|nr:hypothetical protein Voc01_097510 [Virgisporangium ochraceum]
MKTTTRRARPSSRAAPDSASFSTRRILSPGYTNASAPPSHEPVGSPDFDRLVDRDPAVWSAIYVLTGVVQDDPIISSPGTANSWTRPVCVYASSSGKGSSPIAWGDATP